MLKLVNSFQNVADQVNLLVLYFVIFPQNLPDQVDFCVKTNSFPNVAGVQKGSEEGF